MLSVLLLVLTMRPVMGDENLVTPDATEYSIHDYKYHMDYIVGALNNFNRDIYKALINGSDNNVIFSPFSVMTVIAMTHIGTRENTMVEIQKVLKLPMNINLNDFFYDLGEDYKTGVNLHDLHSSNMAYVSDKCALSEEFSSILTNKFHSISKAVNFGASEEVRNEINQAVEKQTNAYIKHIIPSGVLNSLTSMILVTAASFEGIWLKGFPGAATRSLPFWIAKDSAVNIPMMYNKDNFLFYHSKELGSKLLTLDFEGCRLSMVILLPDEIDGLAAVEAKLGNMDFSTITRIIKTLKSVGSMKVEVTLPKFKIQESMELVPYLQKMGMVDLFDEDKADLSGMCDNSKDLHVSNVIHKANIEICGKGSDAPATTSLGLMSRALSSSLFRQFVANHPFIYYIRDNKFNMILFAGRLKQVA